MGNLGEMPNIGKTMVKRLAAVEIFDTEGLVKAGSREAFARLRMVEGDTCFNSLCSLEGAIQGIRWHNLSDEAKIELRKFFDTFK